MLRHCLYFFLITWHTNCAYVTSYIETFSCNVCSFIVNGEILSEIYVGVTAKCLLFTFHSNHACICDFRFQLRVNANFALLRCNAAYIGC